MTSMFSGLEKLYKKKFIQLYEEFLENPRDEEIKKKAEGVISPHTSQFSNEIQDANQGAYSILVGDMTVKDAKKILERLKTA